MALACKIVTRNIRLSESQRRELAHEVVTLGPRAEWFHSVDGALEILLEQNPRKQFETARLTLRVPGRMFRSEASAENFRQAVADALQSLRHRWETLAAHKAQAQKPANEKGGRWEVPDVDEEDLEKRRREIRDLFSENYRRLVRHVRRDIHFDELAGTLPKGALDSRDVVDEAVRLAETQGDRKPAGMTWPVWFFRLVHDELNRQRRSLRQEAAGEIPTEEPATLPELTHLEDTAPGPDVLPPDELLTGKRLEELEGAVRAWPPPEREVFELHFVEGFSAQDIALITDEPLELIRRGISAVRHRLRVEKHEA